MNVYVNMQFNSAVKSCMKMLEFDWKRCKYPDYGALS